MRIVAALGSPNKNGNTSHLLNSYLEGIKESHKDVSIDSVFLNELNIGYCQACNLCKIRKEKKCVIKDDMIPLYEKVQNADLLIIATPIYWWNMTAQTKTFIDRLYALQYENRIMKGKKFSFLTTFAAPDSESSGAEIVKQNFQRMTDFTGMDFIHYFGVTSDAEKKPLSKNYKVLNDVKQLGKSFVMDN